MRALFEKIPQLTETSLLARKFVLPYFDVPLHFHPEYELTLILRGYGKRFVGDSIENFEDGDLVLLGSNLPHFWRCDNDFYQKSEDLKVESVVVQFSENFVENVLKNLPECRQILQLMKQSQVGIHFSKDKKLEKLLLELPQKQGVQQLLSFLEIIDFLSQSIDYQILSRKTVKPDDAENERMKRIIEFTLEKFSEDIRLEQVAEIAHLTTPAFCRYFKQRTQKSFINYLNELRISNARKLLITNELSIGQVGLDCGFRNLSHFHRVFKELVGITPMNYRKGWNQ